MRPGVQFERRGVGTDKGAERTLVGLVTSVNAHMRLETAPFNATIVAEIAGERLFTSVCHHVRLHTARFYASDKVYR